MEYFSLVSFSLVCQKQNKGLIDHTTLILIPLQDIIRIFDSVVQMLVLILCALCVSQQLVAEVEF